MRVALGGVSSNADPAAIEVCGRRVYCRAGDSVAAALIDAGLLACRETSRGERRGVFCGMGVCHECLVTIDGISGQRACMTAVRDGMKVGLQPPAPELTGACLSTPQQREHACDLLVVGGGPAGLAAAAAGAQAGLEVVLVDERSSLGGQYYKQPAAGLELREGGLDRQFRAGRELIERTRSAGVAILSGVQVFAAAAVTEILAYGGGAIHTLRPKRLVIATGAYERGVPLPGWTLPGVMATGAAQTLLRTYQVAPGRRVLISGNGPLNMQVAAELVRAGVEVVALAELAHPTGMTRAGALLRMAAAEPGLIRDGLAYRVSLQRARTPIMYRSALIRAEGKHAVERATVAMIDREGWLIPGTERRFEVDAVCVGFGFLPSSELPRSLGCSYRFDDRRGHLRVVGDERGRTTVEHVWVVGDGAGIDGARLAQAVGTIAGADVAQSLARDRPSELATQVRSAQRTRRRAERFQRALWEAYAAPRLVDQLAAPETDICRCEGVSRSMIDAALDDGAEHVGAVKRLTRAGMGNCQGRYCSNLLAEMSARRHSTGPYDDLALFAPNPPFKPLTVSALANRADEPLLGQPNR